MRQTIYTTCTLDCPDGCGIRAQVEDGRIVKLEGHPEHPFTRGYLCGKTYRFPERVYSQERQLYPMRRDGGRRDGAWVRIGWDEALDLAAAKIRQFIAQEGSLSLMHYQRTGSWGATKHLSRRFWNLLGGVTTTSGSLCSGAARAGQAMDFGIRLGHDPSDLTNSKLVLLWGRNPMATNLHTVPLLKEVRAAGGKVILIDPVRSESATICDSHVQPRVARDAELALAMAKAVLDAGLEDKDFLANHCTNTQAYLDLLQRHTMHDLCAACGLPEDTVRALAVDYATARPAAILFGWGLNKYKHSAEIFRCVDALAALCGYIGVPGGGATLGFQTQRHFDKKVEAADRATAARAIPEPLLGQCLLDTQDPPVRMMFINGGNPINQSPNSNLVARAFDRLEFTVVVDMFLNDTSDYADLFLPTTTFLEEEDLLVSWGHNIIGGVNPVISPVGEARSDLWIFQELAKRLGIGDEMAGSPREWLQRMLKPMEAQGLSVEQVMQGPVRCPTAPQVPFADKKFPTPSGRFQFIDEIELQQREVQGYPLTFVTNFSKTWLLSQMTSTEHPGPFVRIGTDTAEQYGVKDKDEIIVRSAVGQLRLTAHVDARVGPGMVVMPVGTWIKRGGGANVLTEDVLSNFGEMAAYGDTRVAIELATPTP